MGTNGYWKVSKTCPSAPPATLASGTKAAEFSRAVRPTGPNRIGLECIGGDTAGSPVTIRVDVNGQKVAEVNDAAGLGPGRVSLVVETFDAPAEMAFDNFTARKL